MCIYVYVHVASRLHIASLPKCLATLFSVCPCGTQHTSINLRSITTRLYRRAQCYTRPDSVYIHIYVGQAEVCREVNVIIRVHKSNCVYSDRIYKARAYTSSSIKAASSTRTMHRRRQIAIYLIYFADRSEKKNEHQQQHHRSYQRAKSQVIRQSKSKNIAMPWTSWWWIVCRGLFGLIIQNIWEVISIAS